MAARTEKRERQLAAGQHEVRNDRAAREYFLNAEQRDAVYFTKEVQQYIYGAEAIRAASKALQPQLRDDLGGVAAHEGGAHGQTSPGRRPGPGMAGLQARQGQEGPQDQAPADPHQTRRHLAEG